MNCLRVFICFGFFCVFEPVSGQEINDGEWGGLGQSYLSSDIFSYWEDMPKLRVAGSWVWQNQNYVFESFETNIPLPPNLVQSIENDANTYLARADYWLLPFFNVFAVLGHVDGEVEVAIAPPIAQTLNFEYEGLVYGVGAVPVIGFPIEGVGEVFLATHVSYTITDLTDGRSIETWVASPKLGIRSGKWSVWGGATYQATSHDTGGTLQLGLLAVDYRGVLTDEYNWNANAGARYQVNDLWDVTFQVGFGNRAQTLFSVGRRF